MKNPIDSYRRSDVLSLGDVEGGGGGGGMKITSEGSMFKWCVNSRGEIKYESLVWFDWDDDWLIGWEVVEFLLNC